MANTEKKEPEIVIVVDSDPQTTQAGARPRADSDVIVQRAIQTVLGSDNEYLQRLLTDRLEGKEKTYKRIQLSKLVNSDRKELKTTLSNAVESSQKVAVDALTQGQSDNQAISSWVINTVLHEKLKDHETRESADYWKYINGILALVLPIATGVIEYFLTSKSRCDCPGSS